MEYIGLQTSCIICAANLTSETVALQRSGTFWSKVHISNRIIRSATTKVNRVEYISSSSLIKNGCSLNERNSIQQIINRNRRWINITRSLNIPFSSGHFLLSNYKATNSTNTFIHNIRHPKTRDICTCFFSKSGI